MDRDFIADPAHFAPGLPALGGGRVAVAVGPISVAFVGLSQAIHAEMEERYAPFLWEGEVLHEVTLHAGEPHYLRPSPDSFLRVQESTHAQGDVLLSEAFAGFRPRGGGAGSLRISQPWDMKHAAGAVENYLRWTVADLALSRGGFVIHAAGLVREGDALVFFGHSGAGKSTLCSMSPEALLLSDDLVMVLKEGGTFRATTTPFQGTLSQSAKERNSFPLAALFRLRQSTEVRVVTLPRGLAVGMVLSCCPFISDPAKRSNLLIPLVESLCASAPVGELHFRKEPSFWGVVDELRRSHGK
jgi:hypothetical protein